LGLLVREFLNCADDLQDVRKWRSLCSVENIFAARLLLGNQGEYVHEQGIIPAHCLHNVEAIHLHAVLIDVHEQANHVIQRTLIAESDFNGWYGVFA
jgi:hypothetical protein